VTRPAHTASFQTINVVIDARTPLHVQNSTVHLHTSVMAGLGLPDFVLAKVSRTATGQPASAWVVGNAEAHWADCPSPWHATARTSGSLWRALSDGDVAPSGEPLDIAIPTARLPIKGSRVEQMIADNEIGLHRDDAARLGMHDWAVVNYNGLPTACRIRLLDAPDDRGFVRVPFYGRLLLGVPDWAPALPPELLISPFPTDDQGRPLVIPTPMWRQSRSARIRAFCASWSDRILTAFLRAPEVTLRTVEAPPGEDQALTVRLPADLFPLLGTEPGQHVYIEWGPQNRAIATALAASDDQNGLPPMQIVGDRLSVTPHVPSYAEIRVGAPTRAALGIPRLTVVTVRRRITPLIVDRLNQLIVPVTGLFLGIAADVHVSLWLLALGILIIGVLLLAPLRTRRPTPGRVP
jgi:hypothetical protein